MSALTSATAIDFEGLVADNSYSAGPGPTVVGGISFSVPSGSVGISGKNAGSIVGSPFNSALLFSNTAPVTATLTGVGPNFTAVGGSFGNVSAAGRPGSLTLAGSSGVLDFRAVITGDMGLGAPATFFGWTVLGDSILSVTYALQDGHPHYDAIDDFVYGTATAVSEPHPALLAALAVVGWLVVQRSAVVRHDVPLRRTSPEFRTPTGPGHRRHQATGFV